MADQPTEYTPTERTYGHGWITLTHYPSSERVGVVQRGSNAVMDVFDLLEFLRESGILTAHDAEVAAKAKAEERERIAEAIEAYRADARPGVAHWQRTAAAIARHPYTAQDYREGVRLASGEA